MIFLVNFAFVKFTNKKCSSLSQSEQSCLLIGGTSLTGSPQCTNDEKIDCVW